MGSFFKWRFPFSYIASPKIKLSWKCCYIRSNFFRTTFFGEATSSHFFRVTTLTQQLLFRSSYFFRAATFFRNSLYKTVASSQQLYFHNSYFSRLKLLLSSHFLGIGSSLGQVICRNSYFFGIGTCFFYCTYFDMDKL